MTEEGKKENKSIKVLEIENVIVMRDSMQYTVTGGEIKKSRVSYFSTLEGAMGEVSERLFGNKLTKRASEGKADFDSLIILIGQHKQEMKTLFRL